MALLEVTVGVVLGFALSEGKSFVERKKRIKGGWLALQAEANVCNEYAQIYLDDNIAAPSYRLPTISYTAAFPQLLADTGLDYAEVRALLLFYGQAESFNRGLDQAELARDNPERLQKEYGRCCLKAQKLVPAKDASESYYTNAIEVLAARVK